ncbi:O-antigen ligase family protein [Ramlibacter sp.]|uniref:O-antigen ligase family protein n=1 Tax=Ramlibacter sp. TaxID=1917967 RepID=UPI003D13DF96
MNSSSMTLDAPPTPLPERALQATLTGGLAALGVFLPYSTAGTSIALGMLMLVALAMAPRVWRLRPWREPMFAIGLALLAYIAARSIAAGWDRSAAGVVNHYHELLLMPVLWALFTLCPRRDAFVWGLLAGSVGLAVAHWIPLSAEVTTKVELRRISAGFGLSVAAFILFEQGRLGRMAKVIAYPAAAFLAFTVVAAVGARTGYVAVALFGAFAAWRAAPGRWRWAAVVGVLVSAVVVASLLSSMREKRGDIANSNKIRTELLRNTTEVIRDHWLVGTGWVGYAGAYEAVAAARGAPPDAYYAKSANPHNEYLMQWAAGGLPALALYAAWLAAPLVRGWRRRGEAGAYASSAACVAVAFAVASALNSMLLDFTEAHFYAAAMAWLLARRDP